MRFYRHVVPLEVILSYFLFYKHIIPLGLKNKGILKGNELRRSEMFVVVVIVNKSILFNPNGVTFLFVIYF